LISSRKATEDELNDALKLVIGAANDIKIELQDSKGNKKDLRIRNKQ